MVKHAWDRYPQRFPNLSGEARERLERRRRHRQVRYWLFHLQNHVLQGKAIDDPPLLPGFVEFWLKEVPQYAISPRGVRIAVPAAQRTRTVVEWGGYAEFAKKWDVDADLMVYLRHASIWQEWNATLMRVVPVLGEE